MFGKVEYDKNPTGNFTDESDYFGAFTNFVYRNGTVARVACKEGYGTYSNVETVWATKRVEGEVNATSIGGAWTKDLDKYSSDFVESVHGFLLCEPDNEDWKESFRED